jgi:hypothetical protein
MRPLVPIRRTKNPHAAELFESTENLGDQASRFEYPATGNNAQAEARSGTAQSESYLVISNFMNGKTAMCRNTGTSPTEKPECRRSAPRGIEGRR